MASFDRTGGQACRVTRRTRTARVRQTAVRPRRSPVATKHRRRRVLDSPLPHRSPASVPQSPSLYPNDTEVNPAAGVEGSAFLVIQAFRRRSSRTDPLLVPNRRVRRGRWRVDLRRVHARTAMTKSFPKADCFVGICRASHASRFGTAHTVSSVEVDTDGDNETLGKEADRLIARTLGPQAREC